MGLIMVHPIAGTRKRSASPEEDHRLGEGSLQIAKRVTFNAGRFGAQ